MSVVGLSLPAASDGSFFAQFVESSRAKWRPPWLEFKVGPTPYHGRLGAAELEDWYGMEAARICMVIRYRWNEICISGTDKTLN